jgi:hypothetical protein
MSRGIRRYGPGKFNTIIDAVVYDMINSGMGGESCGDVSEVGFAAETLLLGPEILKEAEEVASELPGPRGEPLTDEEKDLLKESYAAIMVENDQGFVTVDYYDDKKEFEKDWEEIQDDASADEDDEDDEDEEEESEENAETEEAE